MEVGVDSTQQVAAHQPVQRLEGLLAREGLARHGLERQQAVQDPLIRFGEVYVRHQAYLSMRSWRSMAGSSHPLRRAIAAARLPTPSFRYMCSRCLRTVLVATVICSAISGLLSPAET